jgi:crotonobetainyl-CoA:carnitine CoA-transferase CaiB-like acyl-CoA transferase
MRATDIVMMEVKRAASTGLMGSRFATNEARIVHRQDLISILSPIFERRRSQEWIDQLREAGVPCGIHECERRQSDVLLEDEQVRANSMLQRVATPYGEIRSQAPHWKFEKTPAEIKRGCPVLGQDTEHVFARLASTDRSNHVRAGDVGSGARGINPGSDGVLDGLRVIEIAQGVAGPLSGMMLRRFGAAVTKIEPPQGDWLRRVPPMVGTESTLFLELNPGKQSIVLDLKTTSARERLARMVREADIVITGYGPAVLARLGLEYEELKRDNPQLIYCGISGWGVKGPMADLPATELAVQAMAGLTRHLGAPNGPPVRQGFDMASVATGIAATQAIQ